MVFATSKAGETVALRDCVRARGKVGLRYSAAKREDSHEELDPADLSAVFLPREEEIYVSYLIIENLPFCYGCPSTFENGWRIEISQIESLGNERVVEDLSLEIHRFESRKKFASSIYELASFVVFSTVLTVEIKLLDNHAVSLKNNDR